MFKKILEIISKILSIFWTRKDTKKFEEEQAGKAKDAEKSIKDAVDNAGKKSPPKVFENSDDAFNNKDFNK